MKALYNIALTWLVLGLASGVFYREWTKFTAFTGETQLSTLHTHILSLGVVVHLVLLALDRGFRLRTHRMFTPALWVLNGGLAMTVMLMLIRGLMQVEGIEGSAAVSGIAGLGHIIMTVGLAMIFKMLSDRMAMVSREDALDQSSSPAAISSSR